VLIDLQLQRLLVVLEVALTRRGRVRSAPLVESRAPQVDRDRAEHPLGERVARPRDRAGAERSAGRTGRYSDLANCAIPASMIGRWNQPGVPHRGWACVAIEDLGEPTHRCEICGHEEIRWTHIMQHPGYSGALTVGCVCAEKMESDYEGPRRREGKLKSRAKSRSTWLERNWRPSAKGNQRLRHQRSVFVVGGDQQGWWATWTPAESSGWRSVGWRYPTEEAAKLALFDARYPSRISVSDLIE